MPHAAKILAVIAFSALIAAATVAIARDVRLCALDAAPAPQAVAPARPLGVAEDGTYTRLRCVQDFHRTVGCDPSRPPNDCHPVIVAACGLPESE